MTLSVYAVLFPVLDPDAALGSHCDALSPGVRADVAWEGFRRVTVGAVGQNVDVALSQAHGGRSQREGDALWSLVTKGSLQAALFRTDDIDATFERVRASGSDGLQEPASQPWGARDCALRDSSGNLIRVQEHRRMVWRSVSPFDQTSPRGTVTRPLTRYARTPREVESCERKRDE